MPTTRPQEPAPVKQPQPIKIKQPKITQQKKSSETPSAIQPALTPSPAAKTSEQEEWSKPTIESAPSAAQTVATIPPSIDTNHSHHTAPTYPAMSRRLHEEGAVIVEILITSKGNVSDVRVKTSSGYKRLDDAAVRAVAKWHFLPATRSGQTIDYWYEQAIEFNLH